MSPYFTMQHRSNQLHCLYGCRIFEIFFILSVFFSLSFFSCVPHSFRTQKTKTKKTGNKTKSRPPSPDDQPCDLRLLTPATCLREFVPPAVSIAAAAAAVAAAAAAATAPITAPVAPTTPFSMPIFKVESLATVAGGAYSCERCGNSYARPHSLNRHKRFECGVEPKFECPICHKKSKHKHNLVLHMRTHQQR